jgi:probable F420-dependent oxidoreductase
VSDLAPIRFSLQVPQVPSHREWIDLVRRAESSGFDMVVTADHLGGCMSPLVALASAAEASNRLRLGTMVLNNDFHHPVLLARDTATLDLLSDGRFELGVGAGHARPEYERAGVVFDPASTRIERLEEAVVVLRALLNGETVTHRGRHYQVTDQTCDPQPVKAPVPILVGGGGRRVLGIGARLADAVGFTGLGKTLPDGQRHEPSGFQPAEVDRQVAHVRQLAGSRISSVELQVLVQAVLVTDKSRSTAEELSSTRLPTLSPQDVLGTPYLMVGTTGAIVERLVTQRERWGFSHYTVRPDALPVMAPIIAELAGR